MNVFKNLFTKPSAIEMARVELEEAERQRLEAMTSHDYYTSIIEYHTARIKRLTNYLASQK